MGGSQNRNIVRMDWPTRLLKVRCSEQLNVPKISDIPRNNLHAPRQISRHGTRGKIKKVIRINNEESDNLLAAIVSGALAVSGA